MRIYGRRKDKATGGWRKLRNEKLRNFLPDTIRVIISNKIRRVWPERQTGKKMSNLYQIHPSSEKVLMKGELCVIRKKASMAYFNVPFYWTN